jgi:hypothetical protein
MQFESDDRLRLAATGDVSAWKVMKYFSVMRILGALRPGFCVNDVVDAEHSIFVVQSAIDLKQSFYGRSRDRRMWLPLRLSMELMSFGRSTLNLRSLVHEGGPDDANFVAENALVSGQFTIVR